MGEIGRLTFIRRLGIPIQSIAITISKVFIRDDLATLLKNLVNFSLVTPEFKKGKDVHHRVDQQFGYAVPLLDLAGISTEFSWAITTHFSPIH